MGNALAGESGVRAYRLQYKTPHGEYSIETDRKSIFNVTLRMLLYVLLHRLSHLFRGEGWVD